MAGPAWDLSPFAGEVFNGVAAYNLESNFCKIAGTAVVLGTGMGAAELAGCLGTAQLTTLSTGGLTPGVLVSTASLVLTHGQTMSNGQLNRLVSYVSASGIPGRILYVEAMGGRYVVDGNHRLMAARQLGIEAVLAQRVFLPFRGYTTMDDLFMGRGW